MKVAVLGGGVNGVSSAIKILEYLKSSSTESVEVTIISELFSPNTTGDGSAGLWGPYLLGGTSLPKVHKWSKGMHDFLEELWLSEDSGEAGVCLIPVVRLTTEDTRMDDFWKDIVYGAVPLTQKQLDDYSVGRDKKFKCGLYFVTYTSEPIKLLPYLLKRFQANGGKLIQEKIENLEKFIDNSSFDVVVNCTGLGSKELLNDQQIYPVRGQVSRIKANWLYHCFLDESSDGNYIIPNVDSVILGGTHQENDYNTSISTADKDFIVKGCQKVVPGLKNTQHLFDWVGLRPGREKLRLEAENRGGKILIHNYGHGGSGVTLAWGCAEDVLDILKRELQKGRLNKSKL